MNEIKQTINHLTMLRRLDSEEKKGIYDTAISALEAQQADAWIPVTERLPSGVKEALQVTIVRKKDNYKWVQNLLWYYDCWKWWEEDEGVVDEELYKVVAWMYLPEFYEGD